MDMIKLNLCCTKTEAALVQALKHAPTATLATLLNDRGSLENAINFLLHSRRKEFMSLGTLKIISGLDTGPLQFEALRKVGILDSIRTEVLFEKMLVPEEYVPQSVKVVKTSVAGLGFEQNATWTEVEQRVKQFGYGFFPGHLAAPFCLKNKLHLKKIGYCLFGMKPIQVATGDSRVFLLQAGKLFCRQVDMNATIAHGFQLILIEP